MEIIPVESGPLATIGYLLIDEATRKAAVIDVPLASANRFIDLLNDKHAKLEAILLTHTHWDHTGETEQLKKLTNAKVYCSKEDEYRLNDPMNHTLMPLPFKLEKENVDIYINDKDLINFGNTNLEVLFTPGHTEGGVSFVNHNDKVIFTGDTLFLGSIGRTDFPGGDFDTLIKSIKNQLFTLGDDYTCYPGHGDPTSIGNEKESNPFLQNDEYVIH